MKRISLILLCATALFSCTSNKNASIKGHFIGTDSHSVYLELVSTSGRKIVDSTHTNKKGEFKIKFSLPTENPLFYNIKCNGSTIPLIVQPGEKIVLTSLCKLDHNYTVEGSVSSALLKEFNTLMTSGIQELDSLSKAFNASTNNKQRQELTAQYTDRYYQFKRDHIKFIINNATDMSAVYALYQRLPGDNTLFNGAGDIIYYKMVADSIEKHYPTAPNLKALRDEIAQSESVMELAQRIKQQRENAVGFPEVNLQDIYGNNRSLTQAAQQKVVLIDFWDLRMQQSAVLNAELRELYNTYAEQGFEIYQISVNTNKSEWILSVQNQKLPWISVCDFKGARSATLSMYNITSIPSNILIDKNGNIVARNIYGEELKNKVARLVK